MADQEKYEILEKIGHGSFGIIRKVKRKTDGHVCLPTSHRQNTLILTCPRVLCRKEINYVKMSHKEREQLHAEFSILSSLRHPNIVAYYHREHLKVSQDLYIYMEYCGGGDLGQVIKNLIHTKKYAEEEFVWRIFSQLVTALYRCHYGIDPPEAGANVFGPNGSEKPTALKTKQGQVMILHRDLKPENIFLGEDHSVKLGDFGLSKLMQSHDFASTYVGTPFYMSPEICAAEKYTLYSDIWSLGCIMYELCAKTPPFNAKTHIGLVQKIREGKVAPLPSIYSPELRNTIGNCLKVNPTTRPDTAALLNLPVIRLMRKEKEVVDLGRLLRTREETAAQKIRECDAREASLKSREEKLEHLKHEMKHEIEATVRREWEVKARLEIDRQVQIELDRLRKKFDREVQEKLEVELEKHLGHQSEEKAPLAIPTSPQGFPTSSISVHEDSDFPSSTDISELSIDSPTSQPTKAVKKSTRTPLSRSKTTFESPVDVQMAEPSPISLASLSLSPRRNAPPADSSGNIFTRDAENKRRREPKLAYSDDEDDLPDLPSPTRPKKTVDPSKALARPGLLRHNTTAAMLRLNSHPNLFPAPTSKGQAQASLLSTTSQHDIRQGGCEAKRQSPNRRLSKIPSSTTLSNDSGSPTRRSSTKGNNAKANTGGEAMHKAVMQRNIAGRTLVELAQARAGGRPIDEMEKKKKHSPAIVDVNPSVRIQEEEVAIWDPERDEMPSPFLVRSRAERPLP